jgi:RND family efflux transporter MFP subunit
MRSTAWKVGFVGVPLLLLFSATVLVLAGERQPSGAVPGEKAALTVTVTKPQRKTLRSPITLSGRVEAAEQTRLYARLAGYVQKVHVDLGDRVKKGDVLAELLVPEVEANLKQKLARVTQATAEVEHARRAAQTAAATHTLIQTRIQEVEVAVPGARAHYQLRQKETERFKELAGGKVIDRRLLDEKLSQLEAAKSALALAETKLKTARATREQSAAQYEQAQADVKVAQARLEVAKAGVQRVEALLQHARVRAPFAGVITRRWVDTGAFAGPPRSDSTQPLLAVARIDTVRVVAAVPEKEIPLVSKGAPTIIRLPPIPGQEFAGKITRLAGALDSVTQTLRAEIELPNPKGTLLPGMSATVAIRVERAGVWTLPLRAVGLQGGQAFCYRVEEGKAMRTPLQVGLQAGGLIEVVKKQTKPALPGQRGTWEDFTGDEVIVTSDVVKLSDGQAVRTAPGGKPE